MEDFARLRLATRPADAGLACARRIRPRTQNYIQLSKTAGFSGTGLFQAGRPRKGAFDSHRAASAARKPRKPVVELIGIEPTTSGLQSPRSPS